MMNYYELLNVDRKASEDDIKRAYRMMAKKYHPDINKSPEASKIIVSLNEAKDTLLDPVKRRDYDALLDDMANSKQYSKNIRKHILILMLLDGNFLLIILNLVRIRHLLRFLKLYLLGLVQYFSL